MHCDMSQALPPLSCPYIGSAEFKSLILVSMVKRHQERKRCTWGSRHIVSRAPVEVTLVLKKMCHVEVMLWVVGGGCMVMR